MKNQKFWYKKRHGIYIPILIIISVWLFFVSLELSLMILFSSTGDNRIGLNFIQNIRWTFVEWSPLGYAITIIILWVKKCTPWVVSSGMICYVLLFANQTNGEWDAYYFSFGSAIIIAGYVIWQSLHAQ